jgi:hypothetical protein
METNSKSHVDLFFENTYCPPAFNEADHKRWLKPSGFAIASRK